MTPQDAQALEAFLSQLTQARAEAKDPQAAALIADAAARQPDTAYLLVVRAIMQDRALDNAQAQIQALQGQLQAARSAQAGGSRGFADSDSAWGASAGRTAGGYPQQAAPQYQPPQYPQQPQYQPPQQPQYQAAPAQPARGGFLGGGGLGGTLGSIATTAAGVAGGAMLFQGIEGLFHHGSGGGGLFGGGQSAPGETVVNNFYGDDGTGSNGNNNLLADNGNLDNGNLDNGLDDYVDDGTQNDDSFF
ncbi:DUF2076 domain-containing protein [Cupriavidus agavae]|uniref:DUF2076 domain-containing protein n=1 Tax=Cupriavidus agavae TaxID=1001822 RepID=A0A4V2FGC8_9BURK|nr:DUF2076 domain-containing protein [Cupriavidus agavae]RZT36329.1 hypothetical protein EV147_3648 [Cupriavidus agavae]